ncbi:MAG TPA: hypothetical protein VGN20_01520 [Mucilaginibacter sp.]|jgi:hypothetical protein
MRVLCLFLITFFPTFIFAQSNYHAGYIIKNNGDTLKGYINYKEWERSPRSIEFKINKDAKQRLQFNPITIKGFEIAGIEAYISYIGVVTMNKTALRDLSNDLDTTKKTDTLFLKKLSTGKYLTIYSNTDEIKTRLFIAESDDAPVELRYYEYYNENRQIISSAFYKGQFLIYIDKFKRGNNKLINMVDNANYNAADLVTVVDKMNDNNTVVKKKSTNRLFAGFGVNNTTSQIGQTYYTTTQQNDVTISPQINLGIDFFSNANVQQLIFRVEAGFSYVNPKFKTLVPLVAGDQTYQVYSFNQYTASLTPQIIFNVYNKDDFKVFLGAGAAFNFSAYANNKFVIQSPDPLVVLYYAQKPYKLDSSWANFPVQAGVTLNKKIEINFSYSGYEDYTNYGNFYARNKTMSLGVKFFLN